MSTTGKNTTTRATIPALPAPDVLPEAIPPRWAGQGAREQASDPIALYRNGIRILDEAGLIDGHPFPERQKTPTFGASDLRARAQRRALEMLTKGIDPLEDAELRGMFLAEQMPAWLDLSSAAQYLLDTDFERRLREHAHTLWGVLADTFDNSTERVRAFAVKYPTIDPTAVSPLNRGRDTLDALAILPDLNDAAEVAATWTEYVGPYAVAKGDRGVFTRLSDPEGIAWFVDVDWEAAPETILQLVQHYARAGGVDAGESSARRWQRHILAWSRVGECVSIGMARDLKELEGRHEARAAWDAARLATEEERAAGPKRTTRIVSLL